MIFRSLLVAFVLLPRLFAQSETQLNVQLIVVQPTGKISFSKKARPGWGKQLRVRVSSTGACVVSVVALAANGQLAYEQPETVHLTGATSQQDLPAAGRIWKWEGNEGLVEIDLVAAAPNSPDYKDFSSLLAKIARRSPEDLHRMQVHALRGWIDKHLPLNSADYAVREQPVPVAGPTRGDSVQTIGIPPRQVAILRIRVV